MKNKTLFLISTFALLTLVASACANIAPATQAAEVQPAQSTVTVEAVNVSQTQPTTAPLDPNTQSLQPAPDAGTQPLNAQSQGNQPMQNGQGGGPNQNNDCRPDLTAAATTLGTTAEALQAALGDPAQGKPDLAAAAATLGVTEDALKQAIQQAMPTDCTPTGGGPGNGQQPPQEAYDACIGLSEGAACTVLTPNGSLSGTCSLPPVNASTQLACAPINGPQQQP